MEDRKEKRDRKNRTGKQDRHYWTGRTGQAEQDRQNGTGRTGQANRTGVQDRQN